MNIQHLLELSSRDHSHLCPRQILGVRIGLAGMTSLGYSEPPAKKQLFAISETDGCFVDGVIAATGCSVGHRTLSVEDYGKVAATFVDTDIKAVYFGVRHCPSNTCAGYFVHPPWFIGKTVRFPYIGKRRTAKV